MGNLQASYHKYEFKKHDQNSGYQTQAISQRVAMK